MKRKQSEVIVLDSDSDSTTSTVLLDDSPADNDSQQELSSRNRFSLITPTSLSFLLSGDIQEVLQFNYMFSLSYYLECTPTPPPQTTFLLGIRSTSEKSQLIQTSHSLSLPFTFHFPTVPPYGTHHTKMMIIRYKSNKIRVIIHTANLIQKDWVNKVQGVWDSGVLDLFGDEGRSDDDVYAGKHEFRTDLVRYLEAYGYEPLKRWIEIIQSTDFSRINEYFVGSVPGVHNNTEFGYEKVIMCLKPHTFPPDSVYDLNLQCSSISKLSTEYFKQLCDAFSTESPGPTGSDKRVTKKVFKIFDKSPPRRTVNIIYPTVKTVETSIEGVAGGDSLPLFKKILDSQIWMHNYLHHWVSKGDEYQRKLPHVKTYARVSGVKVYWYLLTSSNLSMAAWGVKRSSGGKSGGGLFIKNFEAGVLEVWEGGVEEGILPYKMPLEKYAKGDVCWSIIGR